MSNQNQTTSLQLTIQPSKHLNYFLLGIHGLTLIACLTNDLNIIIKVLLLFSVIAHYYHFYQNQHPHELIYTTSWQYTKNQQTFDITPLPSTVITPFAIFLQFKQQNRFQTLFIPHDALSKDDYRHLIVKLKTTLS